MATKAEQMAHKSTNAMTPAEILRRPYARILTPDAENGGYTAEILEFPGCVTEGDTAEEAYANLEAAAEAWIDAALGLGQDIPEPLASHGYAGKIALRLPRSLHRRASEMAARDGTSLNQFLVAAVAERVGAVSLFTRMLQRLPQPIVLKATLVNARFVLASTKPGRTIDAPVESATNTAQTAVIDLRPITRSQFLEGERRHA